MFAIVCISRQYFIGLEHSRVYDAAHVEAFCKSFGDFQAGRPTQTQKIGTRGGTQRGTRCRDTLAEWRNINKLREPP